MADTLASVRTDVLYRLGDSTNTIWSNVEVDDYTRDGYDLLVSLSRSLWDWTFLNDQAGVPTYDLPAECLIVDRATWNDRRMAPLTARELRAIDPRYRVKQGQVSNYSVEEDGVGKIRLWPVPSASTGGAVTGTWGIPRSLASVSSEAATGSWGGPRWRPPAESLPALPTWGVNRRYSSSGLNTKVEYYRRGTSLTADASTFELPSWVVKYVRFYDLWQCLLRKGEGQDLTLAKHYEERFNIGVQRLLKRKRAVVSSRVGRMGGPGKSRSVLATPRLPWNFGRPVRWR